MKVQPTLTQPQRPKIEPSPITHPSQGKRNLTSPQAWQTNTLPRHDKAPSPLTPDMELYWPGRQWPGRIGTLGCLVHKLLLSRSFLMRERSLWTSRAALPSATSLAYSCTRKWGVSTAGRARMPLKSSGLYLLVRCSAVSLVYSVEGRGESLDRQGGRDAGHGRACGMVG